MMAANGSSSRRGSFRFVAGLAVSLAVWLPGILLGADGFVRGDANSDRRVDIADAITTLQALFCGGEIPCLDAADVDASGTVEITDPVALLGYLFFFSGFQPPEPFPECGLPEQASSSLGCGRGTCGAVEPGDDRVWMRKLFRCRQCQPCTSLEDVVRELDAQGIVVFDSLRYSPWVSCMACDVCRDDRFYYVQVSQDDGAVLGDSGWEHNDPPPAN